MATATQRTTTIEIAEVFPPQSYADLWWAAYLNGAYPVYATLRGVYQLLLSGPEVRASMGVLTLGLVASMSGFGREKVTASLGVLGAEGVARVHMTGTGRETAYQFDVVRHLPLLTPYQVSSLPKNAQVAHAANLSLFTGVLPAWHSIERLTLVEQAEAVRIP